jgi:hypothetical protein
MRVVAEPVPVPVPVVEGEVVVGETEIAVLKDLLKVEELHLGLAVDK